MVTLADLWLPIVLSAVICFAAGAVLYMALPLHRKDWSGMSAERDVLAAMKTGGVGPGQYMFPWCSDPKEMGNPEFRTRYEAGPSGIMVIRRPGPFNMAAGLTQMLVFHLAVSVLVAYLASRTLDPAMSYLGVFRVVGTASILAYGFGGIPLTIWWQFSWGYTFRNLIDGMVWGLLTAGTFAWLWPGR